MKIIVIVLNICLLLLCSFLAEASEKMELYVSEELAVWLIDVRKEGDFLKIIYVVENLSDRTIWLCTDNHFATDYPPFESEIVKETGIVYVEITSIIIPENVSLGQAIFARYQKIFPGNDTEFELTLAFPLYNHWVLPAKTFEQLRKKNIDPYNVDLDELQHHESMTLAFQELQLLDIRQGYYKKELDTLLSPQIKASTDDEIYVNCFWATNNLEDVLRFTMSRETIERFLERQHGDE